MDQMFEMRMGQLKKTLAMTESCTLFQDIPMFTSASPSLADMTLETIETILPVHNNNLYLSKIYSLFSRLMAAPEDAGILREVDQDIDRRIEKTLVQLEKFEAGEAPAAMAAIIDNLFEGFNLYYEGLVCFKNFLSEFNENQVLDAMELIFRGDEFVLKAEQDMEEERAENELMAVA